MVYYKVILVLCKLSSINNLFHLKTNSGLNYTIFIENSTTAYIRPQINYY